MKTVQIIGLSSMAAAVLCLVGAIMFQNVGVAVLLTAVIGICGMVTWWAEDSSQRNAQYGQEIVDASFEEMEALVREGLDLGTYGRVMYAPMPVKVQVVRHVDIRA